MTPAGENRNSAAANGDRAKESKNRIEKKQNKRKVQYK